MSMKLRCFGGRLRVVGGLLLALAGPAIGSPGAPGAPPTAEDDRQVRREVADALWWGDFDSLARHHARLVAPDALESTGARGRYRVFLDGLDDALDDRRNTVPVLRLLGRRVAEQEAAEPDSPLWPALRAQVLVTQAWVVRGGGYANTVPPHAWDEFHGLLRQAIAHVAARGEQALGTPLAYSALLNASRGLSLPQARQDALLEDGLRRHPHADTLIFIALSDRLPRWGGSARDVDRFIARYSLRMPQVSADEAYALLYSSAAAAEFSHRLFENSHADWPRMRRGYLAMLERKDTPIVRQRAAYLACIARDRETYLELSATGMEPVLLREWGDNAQVTYDSCRRWGASQ